MKVDPYEFNIYLDQIDPLGHGASPTTLYRWSSQIETYPHDIRYRKFGSPSGGVFIIPLMLILYD